LRDVAKAVIGIPGCIAQFVGDFDGVDAVKVDSCYRAAVGVGDFNHPAQFIVIGLFAMAVRIGDKDNPATGVIGVTLGGAAYGFIDQVAFTAVFVLVLDEDIVAVAGIV